MVEARYGGEDGEAVQLEVDPDLVAVRTHSRRSLREGPVQRPEAALLSEMEPVLRFPEAGVEVYRRQEGAAQSPDELRRELREAPDTRFAGSVLVDKHSREPVLYTENLFVKFYEDEDREHCLEVLRQAGLDIKQELPYATNSFFVAAPEGTGQRVFDIANELLQREDVEYSHPELVRRLGQRTIFPQQWHLKTTVVGDRSISASANVVAAHALTQGANITIAIIDTGIDIDHGEFSSPGKIVAPRDTTANDANPRPDFDDEKHGTACAGVACADGRFGASGVAPRARLMPIRMQSQLGSLAEANAFYWAARNGADIISCSWGPVDGDWWDPDDPNHTARVPLPDSTRLAIDYAATRGRNGKGCVVLFASGNGNESVDNDGYASYRNVLAVAACNDRSRRSVYSDFGSAVFCAFPSNDFPARGRPAPLTPGIWTTDRTGRAGYSTGNFTSSFGGTSSACPGAAGVAALVLSRNPSLRRDEVKDILRRSCDRIDSQGGQYDTNGRSRFYGYGRLNAEKAAGSVMPRSGSVSRSLDESGRETSMGETFSRGEIRDGALDRSEVEHVELESFTSSIVGVAGYYPLGSHEFPTGGFHQTIVGTRDGKLTDLFWRPGETVNQEELLDFSKILIPAGISAVAAYYSDNDGFHHQDVATEDGTLHELFWQPGPGVRHGVLRKFDSPIAGVAAYFVPEDFFHHQNVATENGTLHELFWVSGSETPVNHGVLREFDSSIVGVGAFYTPDGFQHQVIATQDRNVHQLWFRPGPEPPNHRVLQEFTSDILGVTAYITPDGYRRVIVATGDGNLTRLSWKPGEGIEKTEIPHELATRVVAVSGYFSYGDHRQHVILATEDGTVHDLNFGIEDDLGYPGDTASKPDIARWMARCAEERGLPPELPVICSFVEAGTGPGFAWNEGIRNVRDGHGFSIPVDFDSRGFFQQRPSPVANWGCRRENDNCTWQQRLENIRYPPHAITEFLDEAENVKFRDGFTNEDEFSFGAWVQAAQRSAHPERYQLRLEEARILINR